MKDPPRVWYRYVDDVFCICKKSQVTELLNFLNDRDKAIKFTVEVEVDDKLPFLDCLVTKESTGSLSTTVYRKPTHTNHYLNFESHNPISTKSSVIGSLARRALQVSGSETALISENKHLVNVFCKNSYPKKFIKQEIRKAQKPRPPSEKTEVKTWARLPYVKGASEAVARILRKNQIGAAFYAPDTLRKRLVHPKDKLPVNYCSNAVYKVECQDCNQAYVGKTIRNISERMKEHSSSIRLKQPEKSALSKHCFELGHSARTETPAVLSTARNEAELLTKEAIYLQTLPNLMNSQEGHQFLNLRLYSRSLQRFTPRVVA